MKNLLKQTLIIIIAIVFAWPFAGLAVAADVEGVKLADKVQLGDTGAGPELLLNGAGVRTRLVFKVYVGALYLAKKQAAPDAIVADAGAKRVALHLLRDVAVDQFFSALNDGLKGNHTPEQLAKLDGPIKQLEAIFKTVKAAKTGDVILIDYVGDAGTRITINGEAKGTIPGADFNRALLRIWLGAHPVDAGLKKAMLGAGG
jgi:long-chain acyl-CoA synthetase